jgi:hypothetical protein
MRRALEPDIVHARHLGRTQLHAVPVELVPATQIGPPVRPAADRVKPDAVDVMPECRIDVGHPDLDIARSQHPVERLGNPPVRFTGSGEAFALTLQGPVNLFRAPGKRRPSAKPGP